ncbi:hypothetical protein [Eisenbergiella tayi]|uniref:hypothetical protein n=1 Tax=Eisenbergiella tayi TaxID=1432052 RepID=UPI0008486F22|nr:hypothetical protein [Eisenbergiella tayi]ODR36275.1 hypothetical protein BEI60_13590 [Eisenbergiella tayi]
MIDLKLIQVIKEVRAGNYSVLTMLGNTPLDGLTSIEALQYCYDLLPDNVKYEIVVEIYTMAKGSLENMKKYVRDIRKYRPSNYLEELPEKTQLLDLIPVYRGGCEDISKAACSLSWTLSRNTAEWFYNRYCICGQSPNLYKGVIKPDDIISYTNGRNEMEILQYRKVRQIEKLPLP